MLRQGLSWRHWKLVSDQPGADGGELWLGDRRLRDHRMEAGFAPKVRRSALPFSFACGGQSSDELLAAWQVLQPLRWFRLFELVSQVLPNGFQDHPIA